MSERPSQGSPVSLMAARLSASLCFSNPTASTVSNSPEAAYSKAVEATVAPTVPPVATCTPLFRQPPMWSTSHISVMFRFSKNSILPMTTASMSLNSRLASSRAALAASKQSSGMLTSGRLAR